MAAKLAPNPNRSVPGPVDADRLAQALLNIDRRLREMEAADELRRQDAAEAEAQRLSSLAVAA